MHMADHITQLHVYNFYMFAVSLASIVQGRRTRGGRGGPSHPTFFGIVRMRMHEKRSYTFL